MTIDTHSVVYFVNEEYGVVMKVDGASKAAFIWNKERNGFVQRIDLVTASFLARVDRVNGEWCASHPTYRLTTALNAARNLTPSLPNSDGMRVAREAKLLATRRRLHEVGAQPMCAEIAAKWHEREAKYAEM